ncbi:alpha-ketoglutarate-dependent dioxygenase AlkB [Sphingomonas histidinilytica]|jgi:alkylated DNA repair dioxygenase AlkB|uniref:Alkylated DNA repair dioxygenase AlkB n=1 Tax=Rhizorhabdus histidinilytica TaxID=439228 RepID=A0A1T5GE76_9SPHN|nr:alpha-ketoglutarate-dependent dioxygenase AlkB [Rhizorhabdus histidinilytica]MBO9379664.1 alpha-ketoglutarate-dependent dioxygenase AlkB [Rhizorhabdus histidinilytica]QEH77660.1 alpha-ketoglutarate-dependent dioxygenase AlkB [Sphingomonas sp. C8-2]SKC06719.1 Alkylated DNA repair dioxygenase AlkB [Rhizorhabdus histidinilytica]
MADLFGEPIVPGLAYGEEVVTAEEEADLIAAIDDCGLAPFRFQGFLGKRLTRTFGWSYDFDKGGFAPAQPLPGWLSPLRRRAARFAGLEPDDLVHALLIRYDPGAGIGWHRDRPQFGEVIGVSLGQPATLRFRRRRPDGFDRRSLLLRPRSVYHLHGEARWTWEHGIAPMPATRWSITFRSLSEKGLLHARG